MNPFVTVKEFFWLQPLAGKAEGTLAVGREKSLSPEGKMKPNHPVAKLQKKGLRIQATGHISFWLRGR